MSRTVPPFLLALTACFALCGSSSRAEPVLDQPGSAAPASAYSIVINIPAFRLFLFANGKPCHDYPIAVGRAATPTPIGDCRIICRVEKPTWYPKGRPPVPPGPNNPLGRWWLGLSIKGYGIHGCQDEACIGTAVSKGCIRMKARDLEELVGFIGPGTPVRLVYELFTLWRDDEHDRVWLWLGRDIYGRCGPPAEAAVAYLHRIGLPVYEPGLRRLLAGEQAAQHWVEIPWLIAVYVDGLPVGEAYSLDGRIVIPRSVLSFLSEPVALPPGRDDLDLAVVAAATSAVCCWRYDRSGRILTVVRFADTTRSAADVCSATRWKY